MKKKCYPILTYHSINYANKDSSHKSIMVSPEKFSRHMYVLHLLGYRCVSMHDLKPYLLGEKQGKVIGLTFDDGYKDNIKYALPVLKKYGFTATCYIVSKYIGKHNVWDQSIGVQELELMSEDEVCLWHRSGMEVGGHTQHHMKLSELDNNTCYKEIIQGKKDIERILGCPLQSFAYPYGVYSDEAVRIVKEAGYDNAVTTERSMADCSENILTLPRVNVPKDVLLPVFLMKNFTNYERKRRRSSRKVSQQSVY